MIHESPLTHVVLRRRRRAGLTPVAPATAALALVAATPVPSAGQDVPAFETLSSAEIVTDVRYRSSGSSHPDGRDLLDVYMPADAEGAPVLVFFHGGELRYGSKVQGAAVAARLVPMGIGVVSANYRLSPEVVHPAHVEDAAAAVAWVVRNIEGYGGDPRRVYAAGHSAGAYLAVLLELDPTHLSTAGLGSTSGVGPSTLAGTIAVSPFLYVEETAPDRPKTVWGEDPEAWLAASVTPHVGAGGGRMLLIVADGDADWRKAQNRRFAEEMARAGNPDVRVEEVPDRNHTSLITLMPEDDDRIGELVRGFVARGAR